MGSLETFSFSLLVYHMQNNGMSLIVALSSLVLPPQPSQQYTCFWQETMPTGHLVEFSNLEIHYSRSFGSYDSYMAYYPSKQVQHSAILSKATPPLVRLNVRKSKPILNRAFSPRGDVW